MFHLDTYVLRDSFIPKLQENFAEFLDSNSLKRLKIYLSRFRYGVNYLLFFSILYVDKTHFRILSDLELGTDYICYKN